MTGCLIGTTFGELGEQQIADLDDKMGKKQKVKIPTVAT